MRDYRKPLPPLSRLDKYLLAERLIVALCVVCLALLAFGVRP